MVSERNRISSLVEYLETLGIVVNLAKNKAQGNKGFFKVTGGIFRIDISNKISEDMKIRTLVHEFAHFLHYTQDKSLMSLEFIFNEEWEFYLEELINLTVDLIPKTSISPLFKEKDKIKKEIKDISKNLKSTYPNFMASKPCKELEHRIIKLGYKHLLKHDRVKYLTLTGVKILSIDEITNETDVKLYLQLKSKQRLQRKINSKIYSLNKYYNSTTELWARALESYIFEPEKTSKLAPNIFNLIDKKVSSKEIEMLSKIVNIVKSL